MPLSDKIVPHSPVCLHPSFGIAASVQRIMPEGSLQPSDYMLNIRVICDKCKEPFSFLGAPIGIRPDRPFVMVDGTILKAPIFPAKEVKVEHSGGEANRTALYSRS